MTSPTPTQELTGNEISEKFALLKAEMAARMDALEIRDDAFDRILKIFQLGMSVFAAVIIGFAAVFAWLYGQSWNELKDDSQDKVEQLVGKYITENSKENIPLRELKGLYENTLDDLEIAKNKLEYYADLNDFMQKYKSLDPLAEYLAISFEIEKRKESAKKLRAGDSNIPSKETVFDPAFRQKTAAIFAALLDSVKKDQQEGKPRVDVVTLFNVAANAGRMDMDFIALEFMEIAVQQDKSHSPDYRARLVRQRFTMSHIDSQQAFQAFEPILKDTNGFVLHFVLSEVFNIGIHTNQPVAAATLIKTHLPQALQNTSYSLLIQARLLAMGEFQENWDESKRLAQQGVAALNQEEPSARWFKDSLEDAYILGADTQKADLRYWEYQNK